MQHNTSPISTPSGHVVNAADVISLGLGREPLTLRIQLECGDIVSDSFETDEGITHFVELVVGASRHNLTWVGGCAYVSPYHISVVQRRGEDGIRVVTRSGEAVGDHFETRGQRDDRVIELHGAMLGGRGAGIVVPTGDQV